MAATGLVLGATMTFSAIEHVSIFNSLYWAIVTASTVGYGDITPHTVAGRIVAMIVILVMVPLFALFTSRLTAIHVQKSEQRLKEHIEDRLREHLGGGESDNRASE